MENDILMKAIKETAEKYVKDNVKVRVYINEDNDKYSRRYGLQLSLNNCFTYYKLSNKYCNSRTYIMRVVSDLCINLAEMAQRKRNDFFKISDENEDLKRQLEYLRSGEYYNQIRFENKMLQDIVDNGKVSKEDKEFIDCTHRNTELLEQQKEFIKYLGDEKDRLARECSNVYEDSLGHTRLVNEDIFDEINDVLQKYREIIGDDK